MSDEDVDVPFVAFGNDELAGRPHVQVGDLVTCTQCGESHQLQASEQILVDGTRTPSDLLLFYDCGDSAYLAAIKGALLPGLQVAVKE